MKYVNEWLKFLISSTLKQQDKVLLSLQHFQVHCGRPPPPPSALWQVTSINARGEGAGRRRRSYRIHSWPLSPSSPPKGLGSSAGTVPSLFHNCIPHKGRIIKLPGRECRDDGPTSEHLGHAHVCEKANLRKYLITKNEGRVEYK